MTKELPVIQNSPAGTAGPHSGATQENDARKAGMDVTETGERSLDGGAAGFSETSFLTLEQEGRSYGIFLPDPDDHIQKGIRRTGEPYELEMLRDMRMRLAPGDLVLDVGANVGNHALYLAAVAGARVIAFEPNEHLAEALEASVARNTLEDWIQVSAAGLGASAGTAGFARSVPDNLGAQTLVLGKGEITVTTLDSLGIEGPARAIKIDVEGMEIDVLRGGVDLIDRDRPVLYVESHSEACFREVAHFVREHGYTYWETFNTTPTHLFLPAEHVSLDRRLESLRTREVAREYRLHSQLRRNRKALARANAAITEAERTKTRLEAKLAGLEAGMSRQSANLETRLGELAALARLLESEKAARAKESVGNSLNINALKKEQASLISYGERLEQQYAAILGSRTWQATSPLRRVLRLIRRKPAPKPFKPRLGKGGDEDE